MIKQLRTVKMGFVLFMILMSILSFIPSTPADESSSGGNPKLLSFNSYIDITPDTSNLNQPLTIDQSVNVPITIEYSTDVPSNFLQFLPWQIKNIILYGSMIGPMQKITIEVINKPEWADITITQKAILTDIPSKGETSEKTTSLVLSPYEEAPAQPYTITIRASCETLGRINGFEIEEDIVFTPSFVPTVTIIPENPTRTVGPRESVNFKITVKNEANKKARVIPVVKTDTSDLDEWNPTINPPFHDIPAGGEEEFIFSVYTPYDFGWHNEIQTFQIDFTTQIFPPQENSPVGGPYSIYLRINNYGFSMPGFEIIVFLAAVIITGVFLSKKRQLK